MSNELTTIDQHSLALATELAKSDLLPAHLKGKPANVMLLMGLAHQIDIAPMMVFNKVAVINGKPAMSSELMLALLNRSGKIRGTVRYRWVGTEGRPERGCIASATCAVTGETVDGQPITMALAESSGWLRNPLWKSMPDTMLRHRAAAWMIRQYWPDVLMGLQEENEVRDIEVSGVTNQNTQLSGQERLRQLRANEPRDVTPTQEPEVIAPQESPDLDILQDFLIGVAEAQDADELNQSARHSEEFEGASRKTARQAIKSKAEELGLVYDGDAKEFVKKGGAK
jgi:hypothetical protein